MPCIRRSGPGHGCVWCISPSSRDDLETQRLRLANGKLPRGEGPRKQVFRGEIPRHVEVLTVRHADDVVL